MYNITIKTDTTSSLKLAEGESINGWFELKSTDFPSSAPYTAKVCDYIEGLELGVNSVVLIHCKGTMVNTAFVSLATTINEYDMSPWTMSNTKENGFCITRNYNPSPNYSLRFLIYKQ